MDTARLLLWTDSNSENYQTFLGGDSHLVPEQSTLQLKNMSVVRWQTVTFWLHSQCDTSQCYIMFCDSFFFFERQREGRGRESVYAFAQSAESNSEN